EMDITGLEDGLHTIMMRAQNDDGVWSLPVQRNFDVQNVGPGKITAVNYRFFNDAFDGEWESGLITPPTSDVDSVFDLSIENIPLENTYSVELYAQNESGIRGFSVFLNDLDLRVNSSPAKSKDELNLMVNVDQVIQISMDSLFDDPDVAFGDSLSYTLENISNAGLGTFSQLTEGSVFSFSPDRNHIGAYTFAIRATDLAGESDELPVTLDVNWTDNTGNRPPQRLQNQLQLVMFTDQVIEVSLDTLITDPDVPFGDILTYDIVDENNSGVLAFTSTNDNLVYSFSPTSSQVGAYDFTFIATDLNGESENLSVTLEVNDNSQRENRPPFRLIESLNLTMPVGGMIQLSLDTLISDLDIPFGDRLSYSLMDQNNSGVLAFTQTTDNRIYSFSPDSNQSGLYRFNFRATDLFGASEDLPTTLNVNELVTGLDVIDVAQSNIRFFPNPVKDHLNISIEEQNVLPYTLKIYDLHGKIVLQINEVTTKRFKVELNEMPQGIYHLVLVGPGSSIRKRFLYEK
ncbi:MAG: T9SS type A sorting domain-containing protein, partial [Bacteroidota bacterium]